MTEPPAVLVDMDGVISVLPEYDPLDLALGTLRPEEDITWPRDVIEHEVTDHRGRERTLRIRPETPALVARLAEIGPIVWCSSLANAAEVVAPLVGLPTGLPQVGLPERVHGDPPREHSIKAAFVRRWAAEHDVSRIAWLDDHTGPGDERYLRHPRFVPQRPPGRDMIEREAADGSWRDDWRAMISHTPRLDDALCIWVDGTVGITAEHVARVEAWSVRKRIR
ncbi:hypothetical protein [Nocardioides sp. KR10-350]|uniref:hypothetical protein n=1 Tax=Nocardioides cheoyonin TaxID=3156615 RepID=UPI0032B562B6